MAMLNLIYKNICIVLCLFGCLYHSYTISKVYFQYDTVTTIKSEHEQSIQVPAITVCFDKLLVTKQDIINMVMKSETNITNDHDHLKTHINKLVISDQFLSLRTIYFCRLFQYSRLYPCENYTWSISEHHICITAYIDYYTPMVVFENSNYNFEIIIFSNLRNLTGYNHDIYLRLHANGLRMIIVDPLKYFKLKFNLNHKLYFTRTTFINNVGKCRQLSMLENICKYTN